MKRKIFSKLLMGAFLIASVSMFVSCKDYDDDISKTNQDITALKSQLSTLESNLTSQLNSAKSDLASAKSALETAIAAKADASTVSDLSKKVTDAIGRISALETQIATLDEYAKKVDLAAYAKTDDVNEALGAYAKTDAVQALIAEAIATVTGDIQAVKDQIPSNEELVALIAQNAAAKTLESQVAALENFQKEVAAANYLQADDLKGINDEITELKNKINAIQIPEQVSIDAIIAALQPTFQGLNDQITKLFSDLSVINIFVNKKLTSIVLKPDFYWEGIEGIEVPYARPAVFEKVKNTKQYTYYVVQNVNGVWTPVKGDDNIKVTVDTMMQYKRDAKKNIIFTELTNGGKASYHINPSVAAIEGAEISFYENLAEVYTRGGDNVIGAKPMSDTITADMVKNGILTVPFTVDYDKVWSYFNTWAFNNNTYVPKTTAEGTFTKTIDGATHLQITYDENGNAVYGSYEYEPTWNNDQSQWNAYGTDNTGKVAPLPFIAAQISTKDTTVTSDYAVVVPAAIEILALADKNPDIYLDNESFVNKHSKVPYTQPGTIANNHLYVNAIVDGAWDQGSNANFYSAIPMPATHQVPYNDKINLKPLIETHYNYITYARYGQSRYDQTMEDSQLEELGLEYRFYPVDYSIGKNATGETKHIERVDENGNVSNDPTSGWFAPRSVTEDGKTISGKVATQEAVDREPLIRVELVKKSTDETVMYGYIKLRIVKDIIVTNDVDVEFDLGEMWMNCGEEKEITWSQVENKILAKLGVDGMTKKDFEESYYLEVVGNKTEMPTNLNGGQLYTEEWRAKRYYIKDTKDGKWIVADAETDFSKYTAKNNRFGRVWYTPYDNATNTHHWDEQTNILKWNFTEDAIAGKTDGQPSFGDAYAKMIKELGATYKTNGKNENVLETVVRFTNKANGTHVNVRLYLGKEKIHFAYGDINRRVLDHWYDYKVGYKDMTPDTIEVYANVPTPAEVARPALGIFNDANGVTPFGFKKDLTEYWLESRIMVDIYNANKFTKFVNNKVTFQFRLPKEGENADFSAAPDGTWTVPGASGTTWTVALNADKSEIQAIKKNGAPYTPAATICSLTPDGQIHWKGRIEETSAPYLKDNGAKTTNQEDVNEPANDILNYIGMYDKNGDQQKDFYLTGQKDKTFAAYVEILIANDACYNPLIGKNYFNVRFLRPINVWPVQTTWKDAPNTTQIYDIWKLINIRDWRTYAVVMDNQTQQFAGERTSYAGNYVDGAKASVPYSFYNIKNLYVERAEIRSDAYLNAGERNAFLSESAIKNLRTIDAIPALTGKNTDGSTRWEYFKIVDASTSTTVAGNTGIGKSESTLSTDKLAYTNNGGVVKEFHVFVPISVVYSHGALKPWTQTVWAVITIDPTVGNE